MLNRRSFIQAATVALPLAGCSSGEDSSPDEPRATIVNLTPELMDAARRDAAQFESALEAVRKADVPYSVEPRFFPSV
jgi:hypothetical protein